MSTANVYQFVKRLVDVIGSVILIILFFPIIIVTAVLIKVDTPGPIFASTPKRVGKDGKPFHTYKFRSMILDAHKLLHTDPKYKKLYQKYKESNYKLFDDPRITTVGKYIRKHSIDEIPQLINVVKGEMSIVGPRPYYKDELKNQLKKYPKKRALLKEVLSVKPGITGYWQVSGRSTISFDKRIDMDVYYARKKSLFLDLHIMLKTPSVMIFGKNTV